MTDHPRRRVRFTVQCAVRSTFTGIGQVFWRSASKLSFVGETVDFDPKADGKPATYEVTIPAESSLRRRRLDPGTSVGKAHVMRLRLSGSAGRVLEGWQYCGEQPENPEIQ